MATVFENICTKCKIDYPKYYVEIRTDKNQREYWCLKCLGEQITRQKIQRS